MSEMESDNRMVHVLVPTPISTLKMLQEVFGVRCREYPPNSFFKLLVTPHFGENPSNLHEFLRRATPKGHSERPVSSVPRIFYPTHHNKKPTCQYRLLFSQALQQWWLKKWFSKLKIHLLDSASSPERQKLVAFRQWFTEALNNAFHFQ